METLQAIEQAAWRGFAGLEWQNRIDVSAFIKANVSPYGGDESFLAEVTPRTEAIRWRIDELTAMERERGILDADTRVVSSITSHAPGYIDQAAELIVGLQTEAPLKRAIMPAHRPGHLRCARPPGHR